MKPEDYSDHVGEILKFILEQVFTIVTDKEVVHIEDKGFMSVMKPSEAINAVVMMGQLQERLLSETLNIIKPMTNCDDHELEMFSHEILTFMATNNLKMFAKNLITPEDKSKPTSEVRH